MLKQLDILYLIKRVSFTERALKLMLEEHQFKGIHLMDRVTMREARSIRKAYKMRHQLSDELKKTSHKGKTSSNNKETLSDKSQSFNCLDQQSRYKAESHER